MLMPIVIFPDLKFMLYITAAASFAYFIGSFVLIASSYLLNVDVHTQRCREWTTIQIFSVSFGNGCVVYGCSQAGSVFTMSSYFAATVYLQCPWTWLWTPAVKRPAAAHDQLASSTPAASRRRSNRSIPTRSRRYEQNFWGLAWVGTRGASNTFEKTAADADKAQFEADCLLDPVACRELLLKLDPSDLEQRLRSSPYHRSKMSATKSWLREAANTFNVSLHRPAANGRARASKQRSDVEAEVLAAVSSVKAEPGLESQLGRYHPSLWGKLERNSGGRRTSIALSRAAQKRQKLNAEHDFDEDAQASSDQFEGWDLPACRSLLVTLDENDLKRRLEMSPWKQGQAHTAVNWLGEASEAFAVPSRKGGSNAYRTKADIIADVLTKIHYLKMLQSGTKRTFAMTRVMTLVSTQHCS